MPEFLPKERLRWATMVRRDRRFAPMERTIAAELENRVNNKGYTWVGKARLAQDLGCSTRTVQRTFSKLKRLGYLKAKARPGATSFHYLRFPEVTGDGRDQGEGRHCPTTRDMSVAQTSIEPKNEPNTVLDRKVLGRLDSPGICEVELADRIGGYDILSKLKPWQVAQLMGKLREGTLDADDVVAVRVATMRHEE